MSYKLYTNDKTYFGKITKQELFEFIDSFYKREFLSHYFSSSFDFDKKIKYVIKNKSNNIITIQEIYQRYSESRNLKKKNKINEYDFKNTGGKNYSKLRNVNSFKRSKHAYKKEYSESINCSYKRNRRQSNIRWKFIQNYDDWFYDRRKIIDKSWKRQTKYKKQWLKNA